MDYVSVEAGADRDATKRGVIADYVKPWRGKKPLPDSCPEYYLVRQRAIASIARATSLGRLLYAYQRTCVDCGADAQVYDHRDYSKPYEVEPVCQRCNLKRGRAVWEIQKG